MFGIFRASLEDRIYSHIWPKHDDLIMACPVASPLTKYPEALEAMVAVANFGLACTILTKCASIKNYDSLLKSLDNRLWSNVSKNQKPYKVSDLILLADERNLWRANMGDDPSDTLSNLHAVLSPLFPKRVRQYQEDSGNDLADMLHNPNASFTKFNFISKRFESHITGRPILCQNKRIEDGFSPLITVYFVSISSTIMKELGQ